MRQKNLLAWFRSHVFLVVGILVAAVVVVVLVITINSASREEYSCDPSGPSSYPPGVSKPVIYLYPEAETQVSVSLDYHGELTATWPPYEGGWAVTARPDGTLFDRDGEEYYCLFWEGEGGFEPDFSEGFCVSGEDTGEFLRDTLSAMGLTPREYNEFILYWLPRMEQNPYNIISFQGENYTEAAALSISPQPDSVLRVMMCWKAAGEQTPINPQEIPAFERRGFSVVEWGGMEVGD